jgi:DNA-directed RNA polymerase alpha subunit
VAYIYVMKTTASALPAKLAKPAQRALAVANITSLQDFTKITEAELAQLHGIGPNAIMVIKQALKDHGLAFRQE